MRTTTKGVLAALACTAALAGCATNQQGQLVFDPSRVSAALAVGGPQPVVEEVYQPMPGDVYVSAVVDRDVVVIHGDTYLWVTGPDGVRHRQFYAHGDHRADVLRRRDELHSVMARHGGRLPDHQPDRPGGPHEAFRHPGGPEHPGGPAHPVAGGPNRPGNPPVARAAVPNRPAPAAKPEHKDKKS